MADSKAIRVKALAPGFFGSLRSEGDEFVISDESQFSNAWMVKIDNRGVKSDKPAHNKKPDEDDGLPKKPSGMAPKYGRPSKGEPQVSGDDAFESAFTGWIKSDGSRTVEGWNALSQEDRREMVKAAADRLIHQGMKGS